MELQSIIHYTLHFMFPFLIGYIFFRKNWKYVGIIILLANLIDLDHLVANPVFDPQRCSIGFHPLHSFWAIGAYSVAVFFRKVRIIAIGLLFHIFTDFTDCIWTFSRCPECYAESEIYALINAFH